MPSMDTPSYYGTRHLWQPVLTPDCVAFLGWLVKSTPGTFWVVLPIWSHHLFPCVRAPASYYLSFNSFSSFTQVPTEFFVICRNSLYIKNSRSMVCLPVLPILLVFHWWIFGIWEPFLVAERLCFSFTQLLHFLFFFFSEFLFGKVPYSNAIFIILTGF